MRAHLVVPPTEAIEGSLLCPPFFGRRRDHCLLQGAMQALVPPALLVLARADALHHKHQLEPPQRQPRQSRQPRRSERQPVVGADGAWQAVLTKRSFEDGLHPRRVHLLHRLAAQQIAAVGIGDSERLDALAVTGAKPALEVRAPHLVGSRGVRQRLGVGRGSPPLAARHHQAFPPQHLAHGARRRPAPSRLIPLQNPFQLPRPPTHVRLPAAAPTPAARSPPPFDWDDAVPSGSPPPVPSPLASGIVAARNSRSPARSRSSGTHPSSSAHAAHTQRQTVASLPSHCSLSRACSASTCRLRFTRVSGMLPVCTSRKEDTLPVVIFWNHRVGGRTGVKSLERNELQAKSRKTKT